MSILRLIKSATLLSLSLFYAAQAATGLDTDPDRVATTSSISGLEPVQTLQTAPLPSDFPLMFIPNQGQWDETVRYMTRIDGMDVLFTPSEVILHVHGVETPAQRIRLRPLDAPSAMTLSAGEQRPTRMHYFIGQDPSRWQTNVPTHEAVRYHAIQPGVDWLFRSDGKQLVYDLEVAPGVDPTQIRLALDGVAALEVDADGTLRMTLPDGQTLLQQSPFIYQDIAGERVEIEGQFVVLESDSETAQQVFGFHVGDYDPTVALVIDPTLVYSTLFGGDRNDEVTDIAVTATSQAVVVGSTLSADLTLPPFDLVEGPRARRDALIYRLDAAGTTLDYVVILGGAADDQVNGVALNVLDPSEVNAVYLTGHTTSVDFPVTVDGLYRVLPGGRAQAAFVAKLDTSVSSPSLEFASYFGGTGVDSGIAIGLDQFYLYVVGDTASADMPVRNAPYPERPGGTSLFLLTLSRDGQNLQAATYFGGSRNDNVKAMQVVYDTGDIYLAGITASSNFPVKNARQATNAGGIDGFITHIAPDWQQLVFSTYLGGSRTDVITDMVLDHERHLLITGYTNSVDFPVVNALYPNNAGNNDAFITKLDKFGRFLHFSTYLGGLGDDRAHAIAVDQIDSGLGLRHIHVAGETQSNNFPVVNAEQFFYAGNRDGFVIRLEPQGQRLLNSSFFGGTASDTIIALATAPAGSTDIFMAGNTNSTVDFPYTIGVVQTVHGGAIDQFVARLDQGSTTRVPALELYYDDLEIDPEVAALTPPVEIEIDLILRNDSTATGTEIASFSSVLRYDPSELECQTIAWDTSVTLPVIARVNPPDGTCPNTGEIDLLLVQDQSVVNLTNIGDGATIATLTFTIPAAQLGAVDDDPPGASKNLVITQHDTTAVNTDNRSVFIEGLTGNVVVRRPCNTLVGDCDCSGTVQLAEVQAVASAVVTFNLPKYLRCMKVPSSSNLDPTDMPVVTDLMQVINNYLARLSPSSSSMASRTGQSAGLEFGSPRMISGGRIELDLILNTGGQAIAALTSDIHYDVGAFSAIEALTGAAATAAGKSVSLGSQPGHARILVYGLNTNVIGNGVVATLRLTPMIDLTLLGTLLRQTADGASPDADPVSIRSQNTSLGVDPNIIILQQYYLAYYGRPADLNGLNYWLTQLQAAGNDAERSALLDNVRASFGSPTQTEFVGLYGNQISTAEFFDRAYQNILNRTEQDSGAREYWIDILNRQTQAHVASGRHLEDAQAYARADLLSLLINAALAYPGSPDSNTFNNKQWTVAYATQRLDSLNESARVAFLNSIKSLLARSDIGDLSTAELRAAVDSRI